MAICRTSKIDVRNKDRYFVPVPDITVLVPDIIVLVPDIIVLVPDITVLVPDITVLVPDINFMRKLMSGRWPVKTGHLPDIKS